jgi:hypothetical protein
VFITILVSAGCLVVVCTCFGLLGWLWYRRERRRLLDELSDSVRAFVSAPDPDTPSPLAVLLDQAATLFAARLAQQLKAMLAGVESGEAKGEQLALINEATAHNPWLAIVSSILPKRIRNKLLSNPQMIGALSRLGGNHQAEAAAPVLHRHRD